MFDFETHISLYNSVIIDKVRNMNYSGNIHLNDLSHEIIDIGLTAPSMGCFDCPGSHGPNTESDAVMTLWIF